MKKRTVNYWLVKQEPSEYAWEQFVSDKTTEWTGVRNYQAKSYLCKMAVGDRILYYHSSKDKQIVGTAVVLRRAQPDPTDTEGSWVSVLLRAGKPLKRPVTLEIIKKDPVLKHMPLVKQPRLSVMPITPDQWRKIMQLGGLSRGRGNCTSPK